MTLLFQGDSIWLLPLITTRVAALLMVAPVFSHRSVPVRLRGMLALSIGVCLLPIAGGEAALASDPLPATIATWVVQEILVGAGIGFACRVAFGILAPLGELWALQGGLGAANVLDPTSGASSGALGVLFNAIAILIFLAAEGHHLLLRLVVHSYEALPAGAASLSVDVFGAMPTLGATLFEAVLQLAAPFTAIMLVVNVATGILGRSMQQLNLMSMQLPAHIAISFLILGLVAEPIARVISKLLLSITDSGAAVLLGAG